jgi:hypothetical protein
MFTALLSQINALNIAVLIILSGDNTKSVDRHTIISLIPKMKLQKPCTNKNKFRRVTHIAPRVIVHGIIQHTGKILVIKVTACDANVMYKPWTPPN